MPHASGEQQRLQRVARAARSATGAPAWPGRGVERAARRRARPAPAAPAAGRARVRRRRAWQLAARRRHQPECERASFPPQLSCGDERLAHSACSSSRWWCATRRQPAPRVPPSTRCRSASEPGQIGVLIGPSGCGKTSVLRAVAGLEPLAAGRIAIGGAGAGRRRRRRCTWRPKRAASAWCSRTTRCSRTSAWRPTSPSACAASSAPSADARVHEMLDLVGLAHARTARAAPAVGRPAAAHRAGPRAGAAAAAAAARRAVLQPRRRPARAPGAGRARDPQGHRHHRAVRHPRPARGLRARRPHRRDARAAAWSNGTTPTRCTTARPPASSPASSATACSRRRASSRPPRRPVRAPRRSAS